MSEYTALAKRMRTSLQDVKNSVDRALELSDKARKGGDDGYWDGVALNLHGFYTGVEHIFEDIARTPENSLPSGSERHVEPAYPNGGRNRRSSSRCDFPRNKNLPG